MKKIRKIRILDLWT